MIKTKVYAIIKSEYIRKYNVQLFYFDLNDEVLINTNNYTQIHPTLLYFYLCEDIIGNPTPSSSTKVYKIGSV